MRGLLVPRPMNLQGDCTRNIHDTRYIIEISGAGEKKIAHLLEIRKLELTIRKPGFIEVLIFMSKLL